MRLRTDGDTTLTLDDALDSDNPSDNCLDNPSDNLQSTTGEESDNLDNFLTSKLIGIENQISSVTVDIDDSAKSFDALPINEPELPTESTSQVVSQGCQSVVSEVVSQPDAALVASNDMVGAQEPLKVGDSVIVDCPGLKHHNNQGVVVRLKTERFQGKELLLADLNIPSERRYVEVQLSWLHRVMPRPVSGG